MEDFYVKNWKIKKLLAGVLAVGAEGSSTASSSKIELRRLVSVLSEFPSFQ